MAKEEHTTHQDHSDSHTKKDDSVTINTDTIWKLVFVVLFALLVWSNFGIMNALKQGVPSAGSGNQQLPTQGGSPSAPDDSAPLPTAQRVDASPDDDPVKGNKNAPVEIIEFSDFQCPFCGRFWSETLPEIEEKYIKTGKAKLVYRDFPLNSIHPQAQKAAEASECANEQGKFWEYHDKLFQNQQALQISDLKQYAKDLGLDSSKFDTCLDSGKYKAEVDKDLADGSRYGVSGTPSFFINGQKIVGAQPFANFEPVIEAELAK